MRNRRSATPSRSGAALVIVLGFLAILTITIIAFTTQTRTERIATRSYVTAAKTGYILDTALTRAMRDIDDQAGTEFFPPFFSRVSQAPETDFFLSDTLNFQTEADFVQQGNSLINSAFSEATNSAEWLPVLNKNQSEAIGRIGYIIINSSGLLDANEAGGIDASGNYNVRRAGTYPSEIPLSNHAFIIDEFNANKNQGYPHIDQENPAGPLRKAASTDLSVGQAFAYNRKNAWKRFETVRDIKELNRINAPNLITTDIKSFSTYSCDPRKDHRAFMGTNSATLNAEAVLNHMPKAAHAEFVLNQLRDYLDTDTLPEDENGDYTDLSVEPVPMLNEMTFSISSLFIPNYTRNDEGEPYVESVSVSNTVNLMVEVWYPFKNYTNPDVFEVGFSGINFETSVPRRIHDHPILGNLLDWDNSIELDAAASTPGQPPQSYTLYSMNKYNLAENSLVELFDVLATNIVFSEIYCSNLTQRAQVDSVKKFKLAMEDLVINDLLADIEELDENYFGTNDTSTISNYFEVGMAAFDPRLNWDASQTSQWVNVDEYGHYYKYAASMDAVNRPLLKNVKTPDPVGEIYIRNEDRIDTPWEFTHLLYSKEKPWNTFQMLKEYDPENTREILNNLSPYKEGYAPRQGRINPYTIHTNVLTAAFLNLPVNEFDPENTQRLTPSVAKKSAELFMKSIRNNQWSNNPADYGEKINLEDLQLIIGRRPPRELESFFRNSYELFNPRDTLYTVLLAAQTGIDENKNGHIDDQEVQGTKQAVVYVWRDPLTGKAAPVFFGLTDTLGKNNAGGQGLSNRLQAFKP